MARLGPLCVSARPVHACSAASSGLRTVVQSSNRRYQAGTLSPRRRSDRDRGCDLLRTNRACDDGILAALVRKEKMRRMLADAERHRLNAERHRNRVARPAPLRPTPPSPTTSSRAPLPPWKVRSAAHVRRGLD